MNGKFAIRSKRVVLPDGIRPATIILADEKIEAVYDDDRFTATETQLSERSVHDVGDLVVMPGIIDSHVHINEPGRTDWEGFTTATRAAAAGGITCITDMPLNCDPVTTSLSALQEKLAATEGQLYVDTCFWGGVVPGNAHELEPMVAAGVLGFKCFLTHSGIEDFPNVTEADLNIAMPILAQLNVPLLVHAELECGAIEEWDGPHHSYQSFLKSRPRRWENEAIRLMIELCRRHKCAIHIVHLSSSDAVPIIRAAKDEGLQITVETCPHYLTFAAEEINDSDTRYKCAPPIREGQNREALWQALKDGTIDFIVSDHSPCIPHLKFLSDGDLKRAWGGISSLQFGLSTIWTEAKNRDISIEQVSDWMTVKTGKFLDLSKSKGSIAVGKDADLVIWNPDESRIIDGSMIHHKHKITPYDGREQFGVVTETYVRGHKVFDHGNFSIQAAGRKVITNRVESRR